MRDKELYARIVGIEAPWRVEDVELNLQQGEVVVRVAHDGGPLRCPECGRPANRYDTRQRRWRHLDTCQYRTILAAEVPRVQCEHHKVKQIEVPWSESRSRFTALFEAVVIDWLQEATTAAVAQQLGLSWDEVDGVMQRAVQRGLQRREVQLPARLGVDETSFQKRHEYVTVINDLDGKVVYVADGRTKESLEKFYKQFDSEQLAQVHTVAMDMWEPYISVTTQYVPDAENKIAFDKFHIAGHLGDAVDQVRRAEHRRLLGERARPVRQAAHTEPRIACVHRYTGSRPGGGRINPKERYMGATHVTVTIRNPAEPDRTWEALFLVDTGATDCLVPRPYLEGIGLQSRGQRVYELADGSEIKVDITVAEIEFMGEIVGGTIIFGEPGAEPLLGVTALESVGIEVDPTNQRLKRLPAVRLKRQLRR